MNCLAYQRPNLSETSEKKVCLVNPDHGKVLLLLYPARTRNAVSCAGHSWDRGNAHPPPGVLVLSPNSGIIYIHKYKQITITLKPAGAECQAIWTRLANQRATLSGLSDQSEIKVCPANGNRGKVRVPLYYRLAATRDQFVKNEIAMSRGNIIRLLL